MVRCDRSFAEYFTDSTFRFTAAAAQRRFALDVAATNDNDEFSGFETIGQLHVHKKPKGDALVLPL